VLFGFFALFQHQLLCFAIPFADNHNKANVIKAEQLALATFCYHNNCYGNACCWQLFVITTERF